MPLSMYQASVPAFRKTLGNLKAILKKGEAFAEARKIEPAVLTRARLYPDMFPLTRQVQIACDVAKGACCRLGGKDIPAFEDKETTFEELYARIDRTLELVNAAQAADIDGSEEREIVITPGGREMKFKGQEYLVNWVMPNFYFHVTAAYAILRHNGVEVGKMDFLGQF
ncbi:MAG TPA: DUF1993 domain-containing protein [Usitatibacteraceae bacterium]|nr:DUF1993 domain-containing protein [Usitatibacteraceae bacterium]